jgi:predicted nucleic acid-binding protein
MFYNNIFFGAVISEVREKLLTVALGDDLQKIYALQYIMDRLDKAEDLYYTLLKEKDVDVSEEDYDENEEESD